MAKFKVSWKEIVSYEEIVEAETENQAVVDSGAKAEKVYVSIADGSFKIERVDNG